MSDKLRAACWFESINTPARWNDKTGSAIKMPPDCRVWLKYKSKPRNCPSICPDARDIEPSITFRNTRSLGNTALFDVYTARAPHHWIFFPPCRVLVEKHLPPLQARRWARLDMACWVRWCFPYLIFPVLCLMALASHCLESMASGHACDESKGMNGTLTLIPYLVPYLP